MSDEMIVLVDQKDNSIGELSKIEVHKKGLLHRAVSVFIFDSSNKILLQKRCETKYHSANLWSNTACTHPRLDEEPIEAANRRLYFEMGLNCELKHCFNFIYKADLGNGLIEHEYDHVFIGYSDIHPNFNKNEVSEFKYMSIEDLEIDIYKSPQNYTHWFKLCIPKISKFVKKI